MVHWICGRWWYLSLYSILHHRSNEKQNKKKSNHSPIDSVNNKPKIEIFFRFPNEKNSIFLHPKKNQIKSINFSINLIWLINLFGFLFIIIIIIILTTYHLCTFSFHRKQNLCVIDHRSINWFKIVLWEIEQQIFFLPYKKLLPVDRSIDQWLWS